MNRFALDSSAVIALTNREPGADIVLASLPESFISTVNLAEVATKFVERGMDFAVVDALLVEAKVEVVPFSQEQARVCGEMRRQTRVRGLSLGDRACLALALERGATAITADSAWPGATAVPANIAGAAAQ